MRNIFKDDRTTESKPAFMEPAARPAPPAPVGLRSRAMLALDEFERSNLVVANEPGAFPFAGVRALMMEALEAAEKKSGQF